MIRRVFLLILLLPLLCAAALADTHDTFFDQIQAALQDRNSDAYLNLIATDPALQKLERKFMADYLAFQPVKTVLRLTQKDENKMRVQVMMQAAEEARFELWSIQTGMEGGKKVILSRDVLSTVDGLFRLRMGSMAYPVQKVDLRHYDAAIHLESGYLFPINAGGAIAGALFIGHGSFGFAPPDPTEQQQLTLFCKRPKLDTTFEHFYIRASTQTLKGFFGDVMNQQPVSMPALYDTAMQITRESDRNAFGVRLPFSEELWFPRIQAGDLYSELKSEFGTLVYQFAPAELEDILLAQKDHDRIVSLYSSKGRDAQPTDSDDFRILSYKMDLQYNPGNTYLSGTSEVLLAARMPSSSVVFKLSPSLRVSSIESSQGDLLYFQEKTTNNLHVVLNEMADEGIEVLLRFHYEGRISPDKGRAEAQRNTAPNIPAGQTDYFLPPTFLYSNQALWYPQLLCKPYSQVQTTIRVPAGYAAIANGTLVKLEEHSDSNVYMYSSDLPVKYFSMLVGRLRGTLTRDSIVPIKAYFYDIDRSNAAKQAEKADQILRFYSNYFGRYPYRNLNLALRPATEPGGHAPAGIVIANRVYSYMKMRFERDPLWIPAYPDFLLAHEIAHQWWGQAVGWRNYRDQWLSEGFAQFAAAEYIRSAYGDKAWVKISEEFTDWIDEKTDAGPLVLGTRLGHLTDDPRAFSALLYNKGAYVLNMLKNWMGADNFKQCLMEFYTLYQFKRAGLNDFIQVAQRHSPDNLSTFFEQWLYGWKVPNVVWSWSSSGTADAPAVKIQFHQPPEQYFHLKIPVEVSNKSGQIFRIQALVDQPDSEIELDLPFVPARVVVDPLHENLMNASAR